MWSILRFAAPKRSPGRLHCSFYGRDANVVERLVVGASAHICDSCIMECVAILQRQGGFTPPDPDRRRPTH